MIVLTSIVRSNSLGIIYSSQLRKRTFASAIRDHQTKIHAHQYLHVWKARLHGIFVCKKNYHVYVVDLTQVKQINVICYTLVTKSK